MLSRIIIGIMGPGKGASDADMHAAESLGKQVALNNWVLLTGGRPEGVMHAASRGAKSVGGLTLGILPGEDPSSASRYVDIPICTGMGSARNNINVLTSSVVVACGSGAGTLSEVMLALKAQKPVLLLDQSPAVRRTAGEVAGYALPHCNSTEEAIQQIKYLIETLK